MADSTLDFDGDDDGPQRAMMERATQLAGWVIGNHEGRQCFMRSCGTLECCTFIASEYDDMRLPLFGETISVGEYDIDGDALEGQDDTVEGAHAWVLRFDGGGVVAAPRYVLANEVTRVPAAVAALLHALNEIIK